MDLSSTINNTVNVSVNCQEKTNFFVGYAVQQYFSMFSAVVIFGTWKKAKAATSSVLS